MKFVEKHIMKNHKKMKFIKKRITEYTKIGEHQMKSYENIGHPSQSY